MIRSSLLAFLILATVKYDTKECIAEVKKPSTYVELLNEMQLRTCWLGKRYTYRFWMEHLQEGMVTEQCYPLMLGGTRVLEIGVPQPGSVVVPFRLTQTIETTTEPGAVNGDLLVFWEASDGLQTRRFCRFLVEDKCEATPEHLGFVIAGPKPQFDDFDPFKILLGSEGSALNGIRGISPQTFVEDDFAGQSLTLTVRDHPKFGECYVRGNGNSYGMFLSGPEYLFLGGSPTGESGTFDFWVDDLAVYDKLRYPKSGHYKSASTTGSFELIGVERFDATPGKGGEWFPSWPSGTVILDYQSGTTTRIPFEAEEMAEFKRRLRDNCSPFVAKTESRWLLCINVFLLLSFLGYGFMRWRSSVR